MDSPYLISELPYLEDSSELFALWAQEPWAIFLDSGRPRIEQGRYDILAARPSATLITRGNLTEIRNSDGIRLSPEEPFKLLREVLGEPAEGIPDLPFCGGALGYFSYDLARRLENLPQTTLDPGNIPEMAVGIYDWAVVVDHRERQTYLVARSTPATRKIWPELQQSLRNPSPRISRTGFCLQSPIRSNLSWDAYAHAFAKIQHYIQEGDCYQVNFAQRFEAKAAGDPWRVYQDLRRENPAPFGSFLRLPQLGILSSSPERFLRVREGKVETKPIKGTRARRLSPEENLFQIGALTESAKDRAENLMIVDLLRNDLSKTCKLGTVKVPELFQVESFATVHHLVSTVVGELREGCHSLDLLRGCFPGGSITGAPKIRAMEIIEELESIRRGIYCGAIGYIGFDGSMDTNIAIRTLVHADRNIHFWAGGGIVADSDAKREYQESFDKAAALIQVLSRFGITSADHVGG
ncbi:MAG: aminodeoxychorismate synthase component 1 [Methylohalobius crimeensis]